MTPTPESLEQTAAAMRAAALGKPIQRRNFRESYWRTCEQANFTYLDRVEYRPKPEPATVPWDCADDVPGPVCWIQQKGNRNAPRMMIQLVATNGVGFGDRITVHWKYWHELCAEFEYSLDRKTWHPCTKEAKA